MTCSRGCCKSQIEHYRSLSISSAATPSRKGVVQRINATEKTWEKDHAAYKAMSRDGLDPGKLTGAAELQAKAETKTEIEAGRVFTPLERKVVAGG